ncbi:Ring domain protein [Mollivirus kamchatka]|nr:Ring domain protein [Mollivirus kamchatka]
MDIIQIDLVLGDFGVINVPFDATIALEVLLENGHRDRILALVPSRDDIDYESKCERFVDRCFEPLIDYAVRHFGPSCLDPPDECQAKLVSPLWWRCLELFGNPRGQDIIMDDSEDKHLLSIMTYQKLVLAALGDAESSDWLLGLLVDAQGPRSETWDDLSLHQQLACTRWALGLNVDVPIKPFYSTIVTLVDRHRDPSPTCCICLCETPNVVFEPCGHLCLCLDDWKRLQQDQHRKCDSKPPRCPLCRQRAERYWKVTRALKSTKRIKQTPREDHKTHKNIGSRSELWTTLPPAVSQPFDRHGMVGTSHISYEERRQLRGTLTWGSGPGLVPFAGQIAHPVPAPSNRRARVSDMKTVIMATNGTASQIHEANSMAPP